MGRRQTEILQGFPGIQRQAAIAILIGRADNILRPRIARLGRRDQHAQGAGVIAVNILLPCGGYFFVSLGQNRLHAGQSQKNCHANVTDHTNLPLKEDQVIAGGQFAL